MKSPCVDHTKIWKKHKNTQNHVFFRKWERSPHKSFWYYVCTTHPATPNPLVIVLESRGSILALLIVWTEVRRHIPHRETHWSWLSSLFLRFIPFLQNSWQNDNQSYSSGLFRTPIWTPSITRGDKPQGSGKSDLRPKISRKIFSAPSAPRPPNNKGE